MIESEIWDTKSKKVDFFFIKEKVEHILSRLGIRNFKSKQINKDGFENALTYEFKKKRIVSFGKLDRKLCKAFDIKLEVYAADFNWDLLIDFSSNTKIKFKKISKFPKVRRDLSLLIDKSVSFEKLQKIARQVDNKVLKSVSLFDEYVGDKLPDGKKSYALAFTIADDTQTLTDKYVDKLMHKLMKSFKEQVGAEIR